MLIGRLGWFTTVSHDQGRDRGWVSFICLHDRSLAASTLRVNDQAGPTQAISGGRHDMEGLSVLLVLFMGNPPVDSLQEGDERKVELLVIWDAMAIDQK